VASGSVAVVVATHNRSERLRRLLEALERQTANGFEVVIVDDGSTDDTQGILRDWEAANRLHLRSLRLERSAGPATARNAGWRASDAELIAFTDDDCEPAPGWIEAGVEGLESDPTAFVQGPTAPPPDELANFGSFSHTIEVRGLDPAFPTCNMFYRRDLLERVGGFDESFPGAGGEDCDLAWRAKAAGAHAVFAPDAVMHHPVVDLGAIGKLRRAASWTSAMAAYARHDELRRTSFIHGIFWKEIHYQLARASLGLLLMRRRRLIPLGAWLMYPYLQDVWARCKLWGGGPLLAPYYLLHDVIETLAVARASVRHRKLML
jgi:glycosyltransferase involved in cell wall biosynthesis